MCWLRGTKESQRLLPCHRKTTSTVPDKTHRMTNKCHSLLPAPKVSPIYFLPAISVFKYFKKMFQKKAIIRTFWQKERKWNTKVKPPPVIFTNKPAFGLWTIPRPAQARCSVPSDVRVPQLDYSELGKTRCTLFTSHFPALWCSQMF